MSNALALEASASSDLLGEKAGAPIPLTYHHKGLFVDMNELITAYKDVHDLTNGDCKHLCNPNRPYSCCSKEYCDVAKQWAFDEYGIELKVVSNGNLPFVGKDGCVVEPHLRPLCTLHHCDINGFGYRILNGTAEDKIWNDRYEELRHKINMLEIQRTQIKFGDHHVDAVTDTETS